MTIKGKKTYFNGDLAEYTGEKIKLYGGLFHEVLLLDGHLKGEIRLKKYDIWDKSDNTTIQIIK